MEPGAPAWRTSFISLLLYFRVWYLQAQVCVCVRCKCVWKGSGWEQLALHVQLCMSSKVSRQQPYRFSQQRWPYDRWPRHLEAVHCPFLSHPLFDYMGSKEAKSQRTKRKKESWLDHPQHNKEKYIFIYYKIRHVMSENHSQCVDAMISLYPTHTDTLKLKVKRMKIFVKNKEIASFPGTWIPQ